MAETMIKCGQCGQMYPESDIYMDDGCHIRCCDCLGFVRRSSIPGLPIDEVMVIPEQEDILEGDA